MKINSNEPFKAVPGAPAPLVLTLGRKIRFGECDPIGIVWHGTYAIYAEEAREALADACGLPYSVLEKAGVVLPIKALFFDYRAPLRFGEQCTVSVIMHWTEAARLNLEYLIAGQDGHIRTRGFSIQLMTDFSGSLLLDWPPCYQHFARRWQQGDLLSLQRQLPF
jgi:acyl-CoA thioester hydrolase